MWLDKDSEHHVSGMVGLVNRTPVHLHADWCADVYEASNPLANRQVHHRKMRVIHDDR
jgi:hypothetical protein